MRTHLAALQLALVARLASALPLVERDAEMYISSGEVVLAGPVIPAPTFPTTIPTIAPSAPIAAPTTVVSTITVHDAGTALLIVPAETYAPFTVTQTVIKLATRSTRVVTATATAPPTSSPSSWSLPQDFSGNISSAFAMKTWAWGKTLVTALPSLPASASVPSVSVKAQKATRPSTLPQPNNAPVLQVEYPEGSVNPAAQPQGGVGFYAQPIDIKKANNVSFAYSVFFPTDFDFVKGGKLPGLYGGHGGCSGGQESEDCFSTRLMFRKDGMGELYLYVPKGAQSQSLCSTPPTTYCDTTYGYSIGRGAWYWKRGQWSDVRQDIWLNTPGQQDGGFNIWVNGDLVLHSDQVMYRNAVSGPTSTASSDADAVDSITSEAFPAVTAVVAAADDSGDGGADSSDTTGDDGSDPTAGSAIDGGLLGGVADGLLGGIVKRQDRRSAMGLVQTRPRIGLVKLFDKQNITAPLVNHTFSLLPTSSIITIPANATTMLPSSSLPTSTLTAGTTANNFDQVWITPQQTAEKYIPGLLAAKTNKQPTSFLGIMFDTFFGGSDPSWASPRQQYSYFNNAKLWINS